MDGEVIGYDRGDRGEIVRIEVKGPMVCPENFYDRIAAWDFTTTYPVRGDQDDWVQESGEKPSRRQASSEEARRGLLYPAQCCPRPSTATT